jgi:NDP-sugar pyrophosphorylase family protein
LEYEFAVLFELLNNKGCVTKSYEITNYWIDMGHPEDYELIKQKFKD